MDNKRREFIKKTAGTTAGLGFLTILGQGLSSCEEYWEKSQPLFGISESIKVNDYPVFSKKPNALIKTFGNLNNGVPVIIIKLDENQFVCYSSLCTHASCYADEENGSNNPESVYPSFAGYINCACHGSRFSFETGAVLKGPAQRPLKRYRTDYNPESDMLTIFF